MRAFYDTGHPGTYAAILPYCVNIEIRDYSSGPARPLPFDGPDTCPAASIAPGGGDFVQAGRDGLRGVNDLHDDGGKA